MTTRSRRPVKAAQYPRALPNTIILARHDHGSVTSAQALAYLFTGWLEDQMKRMQERLTAAEPTTMAYADLQRFLEAISQASDVSLLAAIGKAAESQLRAHYSSANEQLIQALAGQKLEHMEEEIRALRRCFSLWSMVEGADIMRVFLSDEANQNGDAEHFFAGLKLSPNRAFTWRLLVPCAWTWPMELSAFKQQLWVTRCEFIHDCIHDLGRPLPLMELGEIWQHTPDLNLLEQTIQRVLTPPELAYALAFGALQLDLNPEGLPHDSGPQRPRLRLNPLFTTSR